LEIETTESRNDIYKAMKHTICRTNHTPPPNLLIRKFMTVG